MSEFSKNLNNPEKMPGLKTNHNKVPGLNNKPEKTLELRNI
jgi:hypothetical protein